MADGDASKTDSNDSGLADKASAAFRDAVSKVVDSGIGPLTGSVAWAEDRLARVQKGRYRPNDGPTRTSVPEERDDIERTIKRLTIESVEAAGVTGFVMGLGGLLTLPISIPANIAGSLIINARLAAAIAYLRGFEPADPHVRTVVTLVAVGSNAQEVAKAIGIKAGEKMAVAAIKKIPMSVIKAVNKKVGTTIITKYGTKRGVVVLAKGVPLVGGVVGGAVDASMTALVGRTSKSMFAFEA